MKPEIIRSNDFANDAARFILDAAKIAISERGIFRIALNGGNTPRPVYTEFVKIAGADFPWTKVQFTFSDERCVAPDDDQSNFKMARETLFDLAPIPAGNIFRMRGELAPDEAAAEYESRLAQVAARFGEPRYVHDLLLLGMGDDGHTASLFPGTAALDEHEKNVVANFVPKFSTHRLTFTYPLINAARHVCFLVNDAKKDAVISEVLSGKSDYPAGKVAPANGHLTWFLGA